MSDWLLEDILQDVGVLLLWGKPGGGKTWTALEIARAALEGDVAFGQLGTKGISSALYLNADQMNKGKFQHRVEVLNEDEDLGGLTALHQPSVKIVEEKGGQVKPALEGEAERFWNKISEEEPELVIIDSLTEVVEEESDNSEVVGLIRWLRDSAKRLDNPCAFIIIHHPRKSGDAPLGASQLRAKVDDEFAVEKIQEGDVQTGIPNKFRVRRGDKARYAESKGFEFRLYHDEPIQFDRHLDTAMPEERRDQVRGLLSFMRDFNHPQDADYQQGWVPGNVWTESMASEFGPQGAQNILHYAADAGLVERGEIHLVETGEKQEDRPMGFLYHLTERGRHVLGSLNGDNRQSSLDEHDDEEEEEEDPDPNPSPKTGIEPRVKPLETPSLKECPNCGLPEADCVCLEGKATEAALREHLEATGALEDWCLDCLERRPCKHDKNSRAAEQNLKNNTPTPEERRP